MIHTKIKSGDYKGTILHPHKHKDERYVATTSRFEEDYVRVDSIEELEVLVFSGYGARMSNPSIKNAPSYIVSSSLISDGTSLEPTKTASAFLSSIYEEGDFDTNSIIKRRKEQSLLRTHLLNGRDVAECVICNYSFPFDMLVAAHIKKRSVCKIHEKKDFDNIAALMCKSGCDDLYEKGYITVDEGKVRKSKKQTKSSRLDSFISELENNKVNNWNTSKEYYEWHFKRFNK